MIGVPEPPDTLGDSAIAIQETADTPDNSAIDVPEAPNKQDDSAINMPEAPDKQYGSAIGVSETPNKHDGSAIDVPEAPNKQDDSAIRATEPPNTPEGSVIGVQETPGNGRAALCCASTDLGAVFGTGASTTRASAMASRSVEAACWCQGTRLVTARRTNTLRPGIWETCGSIRVVTRSVTPSGFSTGAPTGSVWKLVVDQEDRSELNSML